MRYILEKECSEFINGVGNAGHEKGGVEDDFEALTWIWQGH